MNVLPIRRSADGGLGGELLLSRDEAAGKTADNESGNLRVGNAKAAIGDCGLGLEACGSMGGDWELARGDARGDAVTGVPGVTRPVTTAGDAGIVTGGLGGTGGGPGCGTC